MYACLCARAAWCREGLNTGRKKLFTARLGPKTRLGAKVFVQVLLQSKYRYGGSYQYCTVEIPTEMEFTGTFQKYLQCVNRMWFSNIRSVCLSRLTITSGSTAVVCCICVQPRENGRAARGGLWTTATSNCHSYRRAYRYWYAQEIIPYYRYFVPVQPRGVGQILMTWSALTNLPRHKIYVLRGLSVENFITANLKIQSAESWTFRLRFAANFKIQFWIPKIAPKIRSEIPVFRPRAPCKLQYLLTISRFRVLNTGNLHGARSKFSIFRRAWKSMPQCMQFQDSGAESCEFSAQICWQSQDSGPEYWNLHGARSKFSIFSAWILRLSDRKSTESQCRSADNVKIQSAEYWEFAWCAQ